MTNDNCLTCKHLKINNKNLAHIRLDPNTMIEVLCTNPEQKKTRPKTNWPDYLVNLKWLEGPCNFYGEK